MGMQNNILVVDDDVDMLNSLKDGIEGKSNMHVIGARNGLTALKILETQPVNLVVTDYRMPNMNGLSLTGEITKHYPDIPVIMITAHSNPETEFLARSTGAVEFIEKPFKMNNLVNNIITAVKSQSEGGTLFNVSAATFLQLIKMEEQVCTIRLSEKHTNNYGVLFFKDGNLLDARYKNLRGEEAAYEIFSWEEVSLQIQNVCPVEHARIKRGLQAILMDAMLIKDTKKEKMDGKKASTTPTPKKTISPAPKAVPDQSTEKKSSLASALGSQSGVDNIFKDTSWEPKLKALSELGAYLDGGRLKVAYMVKKNKEQFMLLPERDYTVIVVNSKCHRDLLMDNLAMMP
jgi:DNA-binding response OmpR family regulator